MNKKSWHVLPLLVLAAVLMGLIYLVPYNTRGTVHISVPAQAPAGRDVTVQQRQKFATLFEKMFMDKGLYAKVSTDGEADLTLRLTWEQINQAFVDKLVNNQPAVQDLREMGFNKLVIANGKQLWEVDLKN